MVAENGGMFSMNLNDSVTHCVAAEKKGIRYQAATRHGDVIHYSWFLDCCNHKELLHFQPKYFLFVTDSSKIKFQKEMDVSSDYYYWDLDISDIKQIFSNMNGSDDLQAINYYRKKYCVMDKWRLFQDCCIYFVEAVAAVNDDDKAVSELTMRRIKVEAAMHGADVVSNLLHATHVVAYSAFASSGEFEKIYKSLSPSQRIILLGKILHVVRHQWLEDSFEKGCKLPEDLYNLRPDTFEGLKLEQWDENVQLPLINDNQEHGRIVSPVCGEKRKRSIVPGRNPVKKSAVVKPAKRRRQRILGRRLIIDPDETEGNTFSNKDLPVLQGSDGEDEYGNIEPGKTLEYANSPVEETKKASDVHLTHPVGSSTFDNDKKAEDFGKTVHESNKDTDGLDSVHAMLLDMVPSLCQEDASRASQIRRDEKPETSRTDACRDKKPEIEINSNAGKKKVSYKDVAGQLLKDW